METLSYCQLMERCIALAAENAGLKRNLEGTAEFCYSELPETPATDAFLAEVRAQGVDGAIAELNQLAERSEKEAPIAAEHHRSAALYLQLFAAQLRQDANTAGLVAAGIITKAGE